MELQALAARLTRLEDLEAIKQLKALYCEICDDGHNPERITGIFTDDAIWEGRGIGTATGHAEIRALFENFGRLMSFTQHMTMNPRIEIDDETSAHGTWYFFGPFTFNAGDQAKWQAARYHEKYTKTADGWKIAHLKIMGPTMSVNYETGWGPSRHQA